MTARKSHSRATTHKSEYEEIHSMLLLLHVLARRPDGAIFRQLGDGLLLVNFRNLHKQPTLLGKVCIQCVRGV
jgi:hypothetical protein